MALKKAAGASRGREDDGNRSRLLQELLAYIMPKKEAEKACKALISTFGTVDGIFTAPEGSLEEIAGLGELGAGFLRRVMRLAQLYLEESAWELVRVYDTTTAVEMFRPKFLGRKMEAVGLILLDGRGRMVYNGIVCEGNFSEVNLHPRRVMEKCIQYKAEDLFMAHNHPSGLPFPSLEDLMVTDRIMCALESISVRVCDHIIISDDSYYSFEQSGLLEKMRISMLTAQAQEAENVRKLNAEYKNR